jgi:CRISPR/Cas system-associated endoribonuclease Cas2
LNAQINSFSSDLNITLAEANALELSYSQVLKESLDVITVAAGLAITTEKTAYSTALTNLGTSISAFINKSTYPIAITAAQRTDIQTKFETVQNTKSVLINKISLVRQMNVSGYIDNKISDVNTVLTSLNSQIVTFSSDLSITLAEANALELSYSQVVKESENIISIASSLSITTEKTNYSSALTALTTEINKWINKSYPLAITITDRTNVQTKFENVQNTKSILINKISAVREANSKTYADQQITELETSLSTLSTQISDFSSDNKLTLSEANALEISLNQVVKESEDIVAIASTLSIATERTNYSTAITNLQTEMNNWINKSVYPITITSANRTSIQGKFESVQSTKSILINKIASVRESNAKTYTDTTANAKLAEIAADDKLTPIEKSSTKLEWDVIVSEKTTIESQATTYGIATEKTTYTAAYNTLNTYITPLLTNLAVTSDIVGSTFRTNFKNYYDAKTKLLKVISDAAKSLADNAYDYAVSPNVNLLQNGGAEIYTGKSGTNIPDGWITWQPSNLCTFTRRVSDSSWTIAGNASFEINSGSSTTNTNGVYYQDYLGATPNKTYTLSGKLGTHRCTGFIQMVFMDASGTWLLSKEVSKTNDSSTTAVLKISGVAPAGTTKIRVHLNKDVTIAGQVNSYLFADNIKLEVGDKATAYVESGNADAINNGVQLGQKYQNVETNSTDGIKVTNSDGSTSKLNGNGLEIRGGNVKMYDSSGKLVMDGRGINPLETSGWGITTGLTMGINGFTSNNYVEVQYLGPELERTAQLGTIMQLSSVNGLAPSGTLYAAGDGPFNEIKYDSLDIYNKTIRLASGSAFLIIRSGGYLWNQSPGGTLSVKVKSGSAILKNGVYVNIPNDLYLSIPVSVAADDADGWQYRVVYLNSSGNIAWINAGTVAGIRDEWSIKNYPDNPRDKGDPNAVILGVILCGGNSQSQKPYGNYVIMHPDFRDERAVKVINKVTSGGKYAATIEKSLLATSSGSYGSWASNGIYMNSGETRLLSMAIGQGKRIAMVSVSSSTSLVDYDDSPLYGAMLFLGLRDPCQGVTQPKMAMSYSGYGAYFIDGNIPDGYLVSQNSLGWNYRQIRDAWLEIGAEGEVYLQVLLYQWAGPENRAIRFNWMCW